MSSLSSINWSVACNNQTVAYNPEYLGRLNCGLWSLIIDLNDPALIKNVYKCGQTFILNKPLDGSEYPNLTVSGQCNNGSIAYDPEYANHLSCGFEDLPIDYNDPDIIKKVYTCGENAALNTGSVKSQGGSINAPSIFSLFTIMLMVTLVIGNN